MRDTTMTALKCATRIRRSVSQLCRKLRPSLQRDGVSMAKLSVIGQINRAGRLSPTELAAREGVRLQTLTRMLAELESEAWLQRTPDDEDRRQSWLSLTPVGKRRLADAAQASDAALARIIEASLSAEERRILFRACELLDALDEALGRAAVAPPAAASVK
jgi:DNA-binding MarR family transcriptional regulator